MNNGLRFLILAGACLLSPLVASAHPGHGPSEVPFSHYLLSPDHLGVALVILVVLFCAGRAWHWRKGSP